jgi:NADH dehydrogenase FAD-containing subunit
MSNGVKKPKSAKKGHPLRIVVIGANFAGLTTAIHLSRDFKVTVIDCRPQFEFLPNIHELLSGVKKPDSLRMDRKRLIERAGHRFIKDTVTTIDPAKKKVYTSGRRRMPYDICVVAVGGVNNTSGIAGTAKFSLPFKSVEDCQNIGRRLKTLTQRKHRVSAVIVGGGLEGVEALGEILRRYRRHPGLEIHLIENRNRLLPSRPKSLDRNIRKMCKPYNVHFHTATRVTKIAANRVWLSSQIALDSDATIWTGGAIPPPLLHKSGLTEHPGDWASVNKGLQSKYYDSIFIAGDAAGWPGLECKQAYDGMDMGKCVAKNIELLSAGEELKDFHPAGKPTVISFGDLQTYVIMGNIAVAGPLFAGAKEGIFQATMTLLDPPRGLTSAIDLYNRTSESLFNLAIPTLTSFSSLKRLADFRFLI